MCRFRTAARHHEITIAGGFRTAQTFRTWTPPSLLTPKRGQTNSRRRAARNERQIDNNFAECLQVGIADAVEHRNLDTGFPQPSEFLRRDWVRRQGDAA